MNRRLLSNKSCYFTPPNNLPFTDTDEEDGYTSGDESESQINTASCLATTDDENSMSFESGETVIPNAICPYSKKTFTFPVRLTKSATKSYDQFDPHVITRTPNSRHCQSKSALELQTDQHCSQIYDNGSDEDFEEPVEDSFAKQLHIPIYMPYRSSNVGRGKRKEMIKYASEQRFGTRSFTPDESQMQFQPKKLNFDGSCSGLFNDTRFQSQTSSEVDHPTSTVSSATFVNKFKRFPTSDASICSVATSTLASQLNDAEVNSSSSAVLAKLSERPMRCLSTQLGNSMNKAVSSQVANINCTLVEPVAFVSKQHVEMSSRSNRAQVIYEIFIYSALQKSIHENPIEANKLLYKAKPAFSNSSELTNNGEVLAETKHSVRVGSGVIYIKRVTTVTEGMRKNKYRSTDVREYCQICRGGITTNAQKPNINALLNVLSDHDFSKDANGNISEVETISLIFGDEKDKTYRELEPFISSTCKDNFTQNPIFYDEHIQLGRQSIIIKRITKLTGEKISGAGLDKIWEKKVDFGITEDRYYQRNPESIVDFETTTPTSVSTARLPTVMKSPSGLSVRSKALKVNHRLKDKSKMALQPRNAQSWDGSSTKSSIVEKGIREWHKADTYFCNDNTIDSVSSLSSITSSAETPKHIAPSIKCTHRGIHWYMRDFDDGTQAKRQGAVRKRSASVNNLIPVSLPLSLSNSKSSSSISNVLLTETVVSAASSNINSDTASTVRSTSTAIEPLASSTPDRRLDANMVAQVRRTMTELSPIPLRNTQSDIVLTNAYTPNVNQAIIHGNDMRSTHVMNPVGASESELDQLKAVIEKSRKNKPSVSEKTAASGVILPPFNMDPQMMSCTVDITEPITRVASMNHMFYHHRRVRLGFMANNVSMAVNLVMTVRSDEQDLKLEPVEMFIDNERVWRRSARIAATKKLDSKEPDSDVDKGKKDLITLNVEGNTEKLRPLATVASASITSTLPVPITNTMVPSSAQTTSKSNVSVTSAANGETP